jgi:galactokinase
MKTDQLKQAFKEQFKDNANEPLIFFAPGRVNLIGEHIDYNGGMVLPVAISFGTYLACAYNGTDSYRFLSLNFEGITEVPVFSDYTNPEHFDKWCKYPLGVVDQFIQKGFKPVGIDFLFSGDLPYSAGLSSSASIEMVTAVAMNNLLNHEEAMIDLVKLSKRAENEFVGVNCGIMDMFASGMGLKNHAMLLDCDTLALRQVPFDAKPYRLIIMNTNKKRGLADSKYNERVEECSEALKAIKQKFTINNLCEIKTGQMEDALELITNQTVKIRARHVISENQRVHDAVAALEKGDIKRFGQLMSESHQSLKEDYEVTGFELDTIVETALSQPGVIGARMTGAGFGGCAIGLVDEAYLPDFIKNTGEIYKQITGLTAEFFPADIENGARKLV